MDVDHLVGNTGRICLLSLFVDKREAYVVICVGFVGWVDNK